MSSTSGLARGVSTTTSSTHASRHEMGAGATSVAPVPLLSPGVAVVVVPVAFPEARLVPRVQLEPANPLGALPEVQMGHQQPGRAAVLGLERCAAILVGDPCL